MRHKNLPPISRNVYLLSFVSSLNDIGGETIKKIIPLYLVAVLRVPPSFIGIIEGIADATPQIFQPISGYLSDKFFHRKPFIVLGQLLRSLILLLSVATSWTQILLIRFLDRSGKGIANAPRDALVTDSSAKGTVGRSFGLTRAFDNAGAVVGFLITAFVLYILQQFGFWEMTKELYQLLILLAVIPLLIAFVIVSFGITDVLKRHKAMRVRSEYLGKQFWLYVMVCIIFTLGNSSDAFLMFRAKELNTSLSTIFLFLAFYSGISAITGYAFSSLSDRIGRKRVLVSGFLLYGCVYGLFTLATDQNHLIILFLLYGFYLGMTEGTMKAWISDLVPQNSRGTAFGIFNMATGITLLPASFLTGLIWQNLGLSMALRMDAGLAIVASVLLFALVSEGNSRQK